MAVLGAVRARAPLFRAVVPSKRIPGTREGQGRAVYMAAPGREERPHPKGGAYDELDIMPT